MQLSITKLIVGISTQSGIKLNLELTCNFKDIFKIRSFLVVRFFKKLKYGYRGSVVVIKLAALFQTGMPSLKIRRMIVATPNRRYIDFSVRSLIFGPRLPLLFVKLTKS